jgi:hypothetical protein
MDPMLYVLLMGGLAMAGLAIGGLIVSKLGW